MVEEKTRFFVVKEESIIYSFDSADRYKVDMYK